MSLNIISQEKKRLAHCVLTKLHKDIKTIHSEGMFRLSQNAKVLKCYAPYAFSGAKLQVFLENGHEIDVG